MLIPFPLAFFFGAFLFDLIGLVLEDQNFHVVGYTLNIAGIIMAVVAAIPGSIDYFGTVPPKSSAKRRATKHALLNVSALIFFTIALGIRTSTDWEVVSIVLIEGAGVILVSIGGWHGGTLVYRNQIGVDPRYADAGKWKEQYFNVKEGERVDLGNLDDLLVNQMRLLHVNDQRIVLGRTEDGLVAFSDHCTHRGGSLAGGMLICGTVQCPWHGSQFSVHSGAVKAGPAMEKIVVYKVEEENGKAVLDIRKKKQISK